MIFVIPRSRFGLVLFVWVRCLVLAVGQPPTLPAGRWQLLAFLRVGGSGKG